ncbi:hypothetical protein VT25_05370 [Photobacterium leiognathi subsp. mandapamensis]|nr:hypothetical protein VT25_05370 [Photobacterium leiognathi subsp. mandapamensis]
MYTYNKRKTVRTCCDVEIIYSTDKGYIGYLSSVEYKGADGQWLLSGCRWLISTTDIVEIMEHGFKTCEKMMPNTY